MRPVTIIATLPWHPRAERMQLLEMVRLDAQRQFVESSVRRETGAGVVRWTITGTPRADGECRRLQVHYEEGFGPTASVEVATA